LKAAVKLKPPQNLRLQFFSTIWFVPFRYEDWCFNCIGTEYSTFWRSFRPKRRVLKA